MEQYKQDFIQFMVECDVLRFGEFTLKSGRKSPFYMNAGLYVTGGQLEKLGQFYAKAIHDNYGDDFDVLFGPAYKGIPLSVATTMAYHTLYGKQIRYCSNRKEIKDHGDAGILNAYKNVTIKGLMVSLNRMERGKGDKSALCEIKEKYGFDANAIVTMEEVVEYLYNKEYNGRIVINDEIKEALDKYYKEYGVK